MKKSVHNYSHKETLKTIEITESADVKKSDNI